MCVQANDVFYNFINKSTALRTCLRFWMGIIDAIQKPRQFSHLHLVCNLSSSMFFIALPPPPIPNPTPRHASWSTCAAFPGWCDPFLPPWPGFSVLVQWRPRQPQSANDAEEGRAPPAGRVPVGWWYCFLPALGPCGKWQQLRQERA